MSTFYEETMIGVRRLNRADRRRSGKLVAALEPWIEQKYTVPRATAPLGADSDTRAERTALARIDRVEQRDIAARALFERGVRFAVIDRVGVDTADQVLDLAELVAVALDFEQMRADIRAQAARRRLEAKGVSVEGRIPVEYLSAEELERRRRGNGGGFDRPTPSPITVDGTVITIDRRGL